MREVMISLESVAPARSIGCAPAETFTEHSGAKVQFYCLNQRNQPCQECLMCRVLNVGVEGSFVLELHDSAECISFSSRRNIWSYMGLKESRDYPLEGGNLFCGSVLLRLRCSRLPLKYEYVKNARRFAFRSRHFRQIERNDSGRSDSKAAISQQRTTRRICHFGFPFARRITANCRQGRSPSFSFSSPLERGCN
jgi:hypothetical protein